MTRGQEAPSLDVSRETIRRLEHYAELLLKWNPTVNLVSRSTLGDIWGRHIMDSAQVYDAAPGEWSQWLDMGSGGGFPGMVIAILAAERNPAGQVILAESDRRKAAFLRTVAREVGVPATVHAERIERLAPQGADVVSARALAPLVDLLGYARRHLRPGGVALFPKGESYGDELREALDRESFTYELIPSRTDPRAAIIKIDGL